MEKNRTQTSPIPYHLLEITNLFGAPGDGQITLSWKDPSDKDLKEIEVTYSSKDTTIKIAKGVQTTIVTGLTNDTPYTFTLKTVDENGNKSEGVTSDPYTPVILSLRQSI